MCTAIFVQHLNKQFFWRMFTENYWKFCSTAPHSFIWTLRALTRNLFTYLLTYLLTFDCRWSVISTGCRTGLERSTTTRLKRAFSFRLAPRAKDRSVPVVVPWCDLTMYFALSARPSLSAYRWVKISFLCICLLMILWKHTLYECNVLTYLLTVDLSPCTGCYKLILLTLYGGPAAAVR